MKIQNQMLRFTFICVMGPLILGAVSANAKKCEGFLCEYGPNPFENPKLRTKVNQQIAKKIGFDLGKVSDFRLEKYSIIEMDIPISESKTTIAISASYRLRSEGKINGNKILPNSQVDFFVVKDDVQIEKITSPAHFTWGSFSDQYSLNFCLWQPDSVTINGPHTYRQISLIRGKVGLYLYRSGEIKVFYPGEMSEIRIGGKIEKTNKPIYFKKNGDRYSQAEMDALEKAYNEREGIEEMPSDGETPAPPCYRSSFKWIPDQIYRVKASDVINLDEE